MSATATTLDDAIRVCPDALRTQAPDNDVLVSFINLMLMQLDGQSAVPAHRLVILCGKLYLIHSVALGIVNPVVLLLEQDTVTLYSQSCKQDVTTIEVSWDWLRRLYIVLQNLAHT
jgi:hypothetical protein